MSNNTTTYSVPKQEYVMYKPILHRKKDKYNIENSILLGNLIPNIQSNYEYDEKATKLYTTALMEDFCYRFCRKFKAFKPVIAKDINTEKPFLESVLFYITIQDEGEFLSFRVRPKADKYGITNMKSSQNRYLTVYQKGIVAALSAAKKSIYDTTNTQPILINGTTISSGKSSHNMI